LLLVPVHRKLFERISALDLRLPPLARAYGAPQEDALVVAAVWTSNSELIEAASTRCSPGARSLSMSACWIGAVHCASCTVAGVVCTCVSRCGSVGSHVSLTWTMYPVHCVSRLWRYRASTS